MIAAKLANIEHGGDRRSDQSAILRLDHVSQHGAAAKLNVGRRTVQMAKAVLDRGGQAVIAAVEQGRVPVARAVEIIDLNLPPEDQQDLVSLPPDDIIRNIDRIKKERQRTNTFQRLQAQAGPRQNGRPGAIRLSTPTRLGKTTSVSPAARSSATTRSWRWTTSRPCRSTR